MNKDKKEAQEGRVKQLENSVKYLEETQKKWVVRAEDYRRRVDFTKGVALGLVFGIIGNVLVQFFYPVVESWVLGEYTKMYWWNIMIFAFALVIILCVTYRYRSQLGKDKGLMGMYTDIQEDMKIEIEVQKRLLETERKRLKDGVDLGD